MNCKKAVKQIYLYRELTPRQREETDSHIATCASCGQLNARVNQEREMMREILQTPQTLSDPVRFTQRIMREVEKSQQKKASVFNSFSGIIFGKPVRYAMAALSMMLVIAFIGEQNRQPALQHSVTVKTGVDVKMNSASFYEALTEEEKKPETSPSVYECVMACLQTQDADCSECRMKFTNLIRNHETI
jgi:hypothetical protein